MPGLRKKSLVPIAVLSLAALLCARAADAARGQTRGTTFLLPQTCQELLPDPSQYIGYLESVANGLVTTDRAFSERILRLLALRNRVADTGDRARENNPVDTLIRKTLCFYREQKEPLRPVPYDDPQFLSFFRGAMKELEGKVEDGIFQAEYERAQRRAYEFQLQKNREVVERVREEAESRAEKTFERISTSARKKVQAP